MSREDFEDRYPETAAPEPRWFHRLVPWSLRALREIIVVIPCAFILLVSFDWVILDQEKPLWHHVLAWVAVWMACDLYQLRHPRNTPS